MADWFETAVRRVGGVETVDELKDHFVATAGSLGFDALAMGEIDIDEPRRSVFFLNTWPPAWFEFYQRENVIEVDPLILAIRTSPRPMVWSELAFRTRKERMILEEAQKFGWRDGLCVPLHRGGSQFGLISMTARDPIAPGPAREAVITYVTLAYERLRGMTAGRAVAGNNAGLTPREIQCLRLVARGLSDGDIAKELGIAVSTAHEYVETAKRKLSTRTRAHAAAAAIAMGIIAA